MKKIQSLGLFLLLALWDFEAKSQVNQSPTQLYIGKVAAGVPPTDAILVSLPAANEVGRFQGTSNPTLDFHYFDSGKKASIGTYTGLNFPIGLYFQTLDNMKIKVGNNFTIDPNPVTPTLTTNHGLVLNQGMTLSRQLEVNGSVGTTNQILMSRGTSFSPTWATIHDDPKVGFTSYIDYTVSIPHNSYIQLTNLTFTSENKPLDTEFFDNDTGTFTAPSNGLYNFKMTIVGGFAVSENMATLRAFLSKNGALYRSMSEDIGAYGFGWIVNGLQFRQSIFLNKNDTVTFTLNQYNSSNATLNIVPIPTAKRIHISMYQVYNY